MVFQEPEKQGYNYLFFLLLSLFLDAGLEVGGTEGKRKNKLHANSPVHEIQIDIFEGKRYCRHKESKHFEKQTRLSISKSLLCI